MSATRNLGIRMAMGDLVAFLDADDVWEPDHLAHEVGLLLRHPEAGLVCGQAVEWHSWKGDGTADVWRPPAWPHGSIVPPPRLLAAMLRRGGYRIPTCNLLVRRSLLEKVGGAEDRFSGMYEDQALLAKLLTSATTVMSGSRTARYRQHAASNSARAARKGSYSSGSPNRSREAYLRWLADYLPATPSSVDPELRDALGAALATYDSRLGRLRGSAATRVRAWLPPETRRVALAAARRARAVGPVRMGSLRRLAPLSRSFGYDRGLPIDRHYIEGFLAENMHLISGRVLEVGDAEYTRRYGGPRVTKSDVLNVAAGNPETTFVADLADGGALPSDAFDCVILTQTLHLVYDLRAAVRTLHRILRPGGTVLATFPGISHVSADQWADHWQWALLPASATRLFGETFGGENVEVTAHGNVLTSVAFLMGIATQELRPRELRVQDPQFPMLITVRASRPAW